MRNKEKIVKLPSVKMDRLVKKNEIELGKMKDGGILKNLAEEFHHTIMVANLSNEEIDLLLNQKDLLKTLADIALDSVEFDALIDNNLAKFVKNSG
jgi:hypothetical protein